MTSKSAASNSEGTVDGNQELDLPFGYRFYPSDDQVIDYLKQKVLGGELPADIIPTVDVYAVRPDQLPLDKFRYGVIGEWFFFTTRTADNLHTNGGYWYPIDVPIEINLDGKIIGFKEALQYYRGIFPHGTKSNWTIYEYRLNPDTLEAEAEAGQLDEATKAKIQNFVACRVRNLEEFQVFDEGVQESCGMFSTIEFGFLYPH